VSGVRVKICGLQGEDQAVAAVASGADLLGFVFAPSRRQVHPDRVRRWLQRLPRRGWEAVGVFVNLPPSQVNAIIRYCQLEWAQLSGQETPEECASIEAPVIKAFPTAALLTGKEIDAYRGRARLFLMDAFSPGVGGGSGRLCDWTKAAEMAKSVPILLAGGLNPDNVSNAITFVRPWGVDVSSGVEVRGVKDAALMRAFVAAARQATVES